MTLKVTGGSLRGRSIAGPSGKSARPTASKIREALFNILGERIIEANFLDLFTGSGIMGFEALSRGAKTLTAVEINRKLASQVEASASILGCEIDILANDIRTSAKSLRANYYDVIFADPPYKANLGQATIHMVSNNDLLKSEGLFILEHQKDTKFSLDETDLFQSDMRKYGQTVLTFMQKRR